MQLWYKSAAQESLVTWSVDIISDFGAAVVVHLEISARVTG